MSYHLQHIFNSILNSFAIFLWEDERQACPKRPIFHLHNRCLQIEFEWDDTKQSQSVFIKGSFSENNNPSLKSIDISFQYSYDQELLIMETLISLTGHRSYPWPISPSYEVSVVM